MELRWMILLHRQGTDQPVSIGSFERPVIGATPADFGLSFAEGRQLLAALQQLVTQDRINAYDKLRRNCPEVTYSKFG
jgi:hypothetical protein